MTRQQSVLLKHIRDQHKDYSWRCNPCNKMYLNLEDLRRHKRNITHYMIAHPDLVKVPEIETLMQEERKNVMEHLDTAEVENRECEYCDFTTQNEEDFQEHMRDHKKYKYECVVCETAYTSSSRLSSHYQSDMHKANVKELFSPPASPQQSQVCYDWRNPSPPPSRSILKASRRVTEARPSTPWPSTPEPSPRPRASLPLKKRAYEEEVSAPVKKQRTYDDSPVIPVMVKEEVVDDSQNLPTCYGCEFDRPSQRDHMGVGGCMEKFLSYC